MIKYLFLLASISAFGQASLPSVRSVDTIADLVSMRTTGYTDNNKLVVEVLGYHSPNDGGGGRFAFTNSAASTNLGTIFASTRSGYQWHRMNWDGNVKAFGAVGDGVTDDTDAIQAAIDLSETLGIETYIPGGTYIVDSLSLGDGTIYGDGHNYDITVQKKTILVHKVPATGNMINVAVTGGQAQIRNIELIGNREQNLIDPKEISQASTNRTHFFVAPADAPSLPASSGAFPYRGFAFFYTEEGYYLGSALLQTVDNSTGRCDIFFGWDNYALPLGQQVLDTNIQVVFSPNITQGSSIVNRVSPADAGWAGINWADESGQEALTIRDVTIQRFHTGLRLTTPLALNLNNVWIRSSSFANIARAIPGFGADAVGWRIYLQGFYAPDDANVGLAPTPENELYRSTLFGMYCPGSREIWHDVSTSRHIIAIHDASGYDTYFGNVLVDVPIKHAYVAQFGSPSNVDQYGGITIQSLQISTPNLTLPTNITFVNGVRSAINLSSATRGKNLNIDTLSISQFPGAPSSNNWDWVVWTSDVATNPPNDFSITRFLGNNGANDLYRTPGVMPRLLHPETWRNSAQLPTAILQTETNITVRVNDSTVWRWQSDGLHTLRRLWVTNGMTYGVSNISTAPMLLKGGEFGLPLLEMNREIGSPGRIGLGVSGDNVIIRNNDKETPIATLGAVTNNVTWFMGGISGGAAPKPATIRPEIASGTDIAGASLTIRAGEGTGSATPSAINLGVPAATSSGTTSQSVGTRLIISEPATPADSDTAISVLFWNGSNWVQRRIVLGTNDSAGTGFRTLRVAN